MQQKLKVRIRFQMPDIPFTAGEQIVERHHLEALGKQPVAEVRTDESGGTGDRRAPLQFSTIPIRFVKQLRM